jgi:hypothetical protein
MAAAPRSSHRYRRYSRPGHRLREIELIVKYRHHGIVPATDDADLYLAPIAQCFRKILTDNGKLVPVNTPNHVGINCGAVMKRFGFWLEDWAPHVTTDHAADIVRQVLAQRRILDADDDLGAKLRLSHADRHRLKIRTIGSFDVDRKSRRKLQKIKKRERDRIDALKRRRAKGALPRAEYEAGSLSGARPWREMGISRATYYRRRSAQHETSPSSHPSSISTSDGPVSQHFLPAKRKAQCSRRQPR